MNASAAIIDRAGRGARPSAEEALSLAEYNDLPRLIEAAAAIRDHGRPAFITYSPKVFIPLTQLCRDVCHYCSFAQPPRRGQKAYLSADEVLRIARAGADAGCHEALFTLGDKPERRYQAARDELKALGHESTLSYLAEVAGLVLEETGLLPHLNPGVVTEDELRELRQVSVSQGIMLESSSPRLCEKGQPHYGSPDKNPLVRIKHIAAAAAAQVPLSSGILIGIGETRRERIEALLTLRELHESGGHIQELIIQNFRRKPDTKMHSATEPSLDELLWTIAIARILFGAGMNLQAPPNLSPNALPQLIQAGINDWGGVSPVTPDHVNPEAAWPHLETLAQATELSGKQLVARLPIYPEYIHAMDKWVEPALHKYVLRRMDAAAYARTDSWAPGSAEAIPVIRRGGKVLPFIKNPSSLSVDKAMSGTRLKEQEIAELFLARGQDYERIRHAADELRAEVNGDVVSYVVNRNINYTNICYFGCGFCAFSKGRVAENLRERGYDISLDEIKRRTHEAWERGATEVCLQGGIHPAYTGETYLAIARAVKAARPQMHLHAFSPLEVSHGAQTLGLPIKDFLIKLRQAGLDTLPGTAAEILDDEVRRIICADKLNTGEWLHAIRTAHGLGLKTTATIMYGHVERPLHWARHLLRLRDLQEYSGGFTEFVPLPFVHMEAPLYRRGRARTGPTFREAVLMHAIARLVLYPHITNIQTSWVKMGAEGVKVCLQSGVNDLGGTLMNESISRAAGASHGQEFTATKMRALIHSLDKVPRQRTTLYDDAPANPTFAPAINGPVSSFMYA